MPPINRRDFMGGLLAGASAALAVRTVSAAPLASAADRVVLGRTGIESSFLGLGTGMRGYNRQSNHTRMGHEAFEQLCRHAFDRGLTLFDVADLYGTHTYFAPMIREFGRDKLTIQSKIWFSRRGLPEQVTDARAAVERFLRELGTDHLDIVLLHCTSSANWLTELEDMRAALEQARQDGLIRAHGTSCHSLPAMQASRDSDWSQIQLARINDAKRNMDGSPAEIAELLRTMRASGKGVIGMKIFGEGSINTPEGRESSLRFVLREKPIDAMVIGFEQPAQIDETVGMIQRILAG
jgi:aryl-alcohol dehydrogenase-like predicted oxidoreductase